MKDKDGFYILKRKEPKKASKKNRKATIKLDCKEQAVKVKKPKVKFKKGGWKWKLWDSIKRWKSGRLVSHFRHREKTDYMIYHPDGDCMYATPRSGGFPIDLVKATRKVDPDAFVMVPCGAHMYTRLPLKTYQKLMKIEKVAIRVNVTAYYDDATEEPCTITEYTDVIDNINALLGKINYYRNCILGLLDIQDESSGFVDYVFNFKVMVYKQDGTIDTYNSDLNDFLHDYDLYLI